MSNFVKNCVALFLFGSVTVGSLGQVGWTNVPSPPSPNTSGQISGARNSMNDAFGNFQSAVSGMEARDRANWERQKNVNTQEYLNAIYSLNTVADLERSKYKLEAMRYQYGSQIDPNVARDAFDARMLALSRLEAGAKNDR